MGEGEDSLPIRVAQTEILPMEKSAVDESIEDECEKRTGCDYFVDSWVELVMVFPAWVSWVAVKCEPQVHLIPYT